MPSIKVDVATLLSKVELAIDTTQGLDESDDALAQALRNYLAIHS